MPTDNKMTMSQEGRDLALIFTLANTAVNQAILQEIYMHTVGSSPEQTEAHIADIRKQTFADVCATLASMATSMFRACFKSLPDNLLPTALSLPGSS